jgi:hypothetical protein
MCTLVADPVNAIYQSSKCKKFGFLVNGKPMKHLIFSGEVQRLHSVKTKYGYFVKIDKSGSDLFMFLELLKQAVEDALPGKTVHNRCKEGHEPFAFISIHEDIRPGRFLDYNYDPLPVKAIEDLVPFVNLGAELKMRVGVDFIDMNGIIYIKPVIFDMCVKTATLQMWDDST